MRHREAQYHLKARDQKDFIMFLKVSFAHQGCNFLSSLLFSVTCSFRNHSSMLI